MGKTRGFTLIELMVTIAVLAVIAMMAVPAFNNMMLAQNFNKSTQELILTLNQARAKAVQERREVEVSLKSDSTSTPSANTDSQFNWVPVGKAVLKSGSNTSVYFNLTGGVCALDGSTPAKCIPVNSDTSIEICNKSSGDKSKTVSVSRMGTIQQTTDGAC